MDHSHFGLKRLSFHLQGFDGEYWGAVSIGKYCGSEMPPVIWSTSNVLVIHFYSDSGITGRGFNATYRFYNGMALISYGLNCHRWQI